MPPDGADPTAQGRPRLTLHAIDTFHGRPAAGLVCDLAVRDGDAYRPLRTAVTGADGRTPEPLLAGAALAAGRYELLAHVGAYFAAAGVALPSPAFLDRVPIRFRILDAGRRTHLPVLFTPWGYSYYRGS